MLVFYLAALAVLFVSAFWSIDSFTGKLTHTWTWDNFHAIVSDPTYREIAWRTIWMAAAVTITDAVVAFPFAYYMARIATPRVVASSSRRETISRTRSFMSTSSRRGAPRV